MEFKTLLIEDDGPITWITLNRPHRLNAMSDELLGEFSQALEALKTEGAPVLGIRGAGRAFCTGYDIADDSDEVGGAAHRDITEDRLRLAKNIERFLGIWDHPKPIIAAIHGYCLAGATQMCVFTDLTIVAEDAQIGLPSIPIGGGYITPMWTPLVGPKRAKQMSFMAGSKISGTTAVEWGWANYAVKADELFEHVRGVADEISKIPSSILTVKKQAINRAAEVQGFRTIVPMGAETDALLHFSAPVQSMSAMIVEHGLKEAIRRFDTREWSE